MIKESVTKMSGETFDEVLKELYATYGDKLSNATINIFFQNNIFEFIIEGKLESYESEFYIQTGDFRKKDIGFASIKIDKKEKVKSINVKDYVFLIELKDCIIKIYY